MSDNVIKFPQKQKYTMCFLVPEEFSMTGNSAIHWTFDNQYGTAEVEARSYEEAKILIENHVPVLEWFDSIMKTVTIDELFQKDE